MMGYEVVITIESHRDAWGIKHADDYTCKVRTYTAATHLSESADNAFPCCTVTITRIKFDAKCRAETPYASEGKAWDFYGRPELLEEFKEWVYTHFARSTYSVR